MSKTFSPAAFAAAFLSLCGLTLAQTYTKCNPLDATCPADPALGKSYSWNFASGGSNQFTASGNSISYNSAGAQLTVSESGDSPTIISNWYIMFGHVEAVIQTAPGVGMVSSFLLQSDDLDEIDWEILGADPTSAQTNYFGKGYTGTYNRGTTVTDSTSQSAFNTYTIDWTEEQIVWSINGAVMRTLPASEAGNYYPQTPMTVRLGAWAGGDPSNAPGTITWAGGPINYADGPFTMQVASISVTDYSTGSQYVYQGNSGSWQSIEAVGGAVNGNLGGSAGSSTGGSDSSPAPAPSPTTSSSSTTENSGASSDNIHHTGFPWVPYSTGAAGAHTSHTSFLTNAEQTSSSPSPARTTSPPAHSSPTSLPCKTCAPPALGGNNGPSTTLAKTTKPAKTIAPPSSFTGAASHLTGGTLWSAAVVGAAALLAF